VFLTRRRRQLFGFFPPPAEFPGAYPERTVEALGKSFAALKKTKAFQENFL
jgi:hypothetical protein